MKLPNSYGSVYKLKGKRRKPWCVRKTIGWKQNEDNRTAYPVYKYIGYYATKQEGLQALAEFNADPYDLHHSTITFEEVFEKWFDDKFSAPDANMKSARDYKAQMKLCESIKDMKFVDIKIDHVQEIIDTSGKNKPMLRKLKSMFNLIYEYAVIHEIVPQSKADLMRKVDISKAGNPNAFDRKPFTTEQVEMFWNAKDSNIYMTVVLMLIYTGVRISEMLSLEKKDVHLNERWFYIKESKTDAGIREVPISEKIVPFFEYWINRDCEYLICTPKDKPFDYRNYYDSYWTPIVESLGFNGYTPHCTRHTCVSMLTANGVDERIIRKIVGHRGQGVTETVYTHLELPVKLEAINKI